MLVFRVDEHILLWHVRSDWRRQILITA